MNLTPFPTVCHKDGTVSYWSVMQQARLFGQVLTHWTVTA